MRYIIAQTSRAPAKGNEHEQNTRRKTQRATLQHKRTQEDPTYKNRKQEQRDQREPDRERESTHPHKEKPKTAPTARKDTLLPPKDPTSTKHEGEPQATKTPRPAAPAQHLPNQRSTGKRNSQKPAKKCCSATHL